MSSHGLAKGMFTCQRRDIRVSGLQGALLAKAVVVQGGAISVQTAQSPLMFAECATAMRHKVGCAEMALIFLEQFSALARHSDKLSGAAALAMSWFQPYVGMSCYSYATTMYSYPPSS